MIIIYYTCDAYSTHTCITSVSSACILHGSKPNTRASAWMHYSCSNAGRAFEAGCSCGSRLLAQILSVKSVAALEPALLTDVLQGFKQLYDPILAYKFMYPVQTASGEQLQMVLTRPPEKVRLMQQQLALGNVLQTAPLHTTTLQISISTSCSAAGHIWCVFTRTQQLQPLCLGCSTMSKSWNADS